MTNPLTTVASLFEYIKKRMVYTLGIFSCISPCGKKSHHSTYRTHAYLRKYFFSCIFPCGTNHTIVRTERMRICEIYMGEKKEKTFFGGPVLFVLAWEMFISGCRSRLKNAACLNSVLSLPTTCSRLTL